MKTYKLKIFLKSKKKSFDIESSSEKAIDSCERQLIERLNDDSNYVTFEALTFSKSDFSHLIKQ